jgi:hypothetical protein
MSAIVANPPPMVPVYCPECLKRGRRNLCTRAAKGAMVEAFCRHCKFRKVVLVC